MYKYKFHCKKCGFYTEASTKRDWAIEKQQHKKNGCRLEFAPHYDGFILTRPELALEARAGKDHLAEQRKKEDEESNPSD